MSKKLSLFSESVPFVNEVEEFNALMNKPNNYEPTIPEKKEWQFVIDFVKEELAEYEEACKNGDIVEILDALCDIAYVSLGNGVMLHGLKDKIWPAYQEVQASNLIVKLAQLRKKPYLLSPNEVKNKVSHVIGKK